MTSGSISAPPCGMPRSRYASIIPPAQSSACSGAARAAQADAEPDLSISPHVPALQNRQARDDAGQCLPILLRLQRLRRASATEAGRLLRVLLLWRCTL